MLRLLQLLDHRTIGMDPIGSLHHPLPHRRGEDHADRLRRPVPLRRERIVDNHVHYLNVPSTMPPADDRQLPHRSDGFGCLTELNQFIN